MKLQKLRIKNFKSIVDLELDNPSPFSVFVGPNGAGKSNIFEALEYVSYTNIMLPQQIQRVFGGKDLLNKTTNDNLIEIEMSILGYQTSKHRFKIYERAEELIHSIYHGSFNDRRNDRIFADEIFYKNFSRIYINNEKTNRMKISDNLRLSSDANNLELVVERLLADSNVEDEIVTWLQLFVPELNKIEIDPHPVDGEKLLFYDNNLQEPIKKALASNGTINILVLLTAVLQSDEAQFLCIEEPENGLHPQVIMSLVDFFRQQCEEKGHYIWLNTHSESLVRKLHPEEIILVDKREGQTKIKQVRDMNLYDLPTDEAWLTGALGGGLPW